MSSEAIKAAFDNLTSGASRRAELEYSVDSATHHEADSIEVSEVGSMRLCVDVPQLCSAIQTNLKGSSMDN